MDGVLIIDKPEGPTSFRVVDRVRFALKTKRAGHTGTLDPMATGVLAICLGEATRIAGYLAEGDKVYEATVGLGAATDTQDRTGKVIAEAPVPSLDADRIAEVLRRFEGELEQAPPMFSAVRVDGRRLYELARQGQEVERAARRVVIHRLELLGLEPQGFRFRVRCSKGTYVRTLAHDMGEALGCHGHLVALRRTASGAFGVEQAITLEQLKQLPVEEVEARLVPEKDALSFIPAVVVPPAAEPRIRHGQKLTAADAPALAGVAAGTRVRLVSEQGALLALAEAAAEAVRYLRVLVRGGS